MREECHWTKRTDQTEIDRKMISGAKKKMDLSRLTEPLRNALSTVTFRERESVASWSTVQWCPSKCDYVGPGPELTKLIEPNRIAFMTLFVMSKFGFRLCDCNCHTTQSAYRMICTIRV
jgi:hypothetical protein